MSWDKELVLILAAIRFMSWTLLGKESGDDVLICNNQDKCSDAVP